MKRLPGVIVVLNNVITLAINMKPNNAIKNVYPDSHNIVFPSQFSVMSLLGIYMNQESLKVAQQGLLILFGVSLHTKYLL